MVRKILILLLVCVAVVATYFALTRERFYSTDSRKALEYYQSGVDNIMKFYMPEGIRDMAMAAEEDPEFPLPHLLLLRAEPYSMDKKEQAGWYKKLAVPSPEWTEFEKGLITLSMGKPEQEDREKVAAEIEDFLQKYPSRLEAFFLLINKYRQLVENPEKMIRFYETMHRQYPNNAQILNMMGYFYAALGQPDKAKVVFEKYVYIQPDEANPYDSFGDFYYNTGEFDKAEGYYRKALARKPDFDASKLHLVQTLLRMGKVSAAQGVLDEIEKDKTGAITANSTIFLRFLCYMFTGNMAEMEKLVDRLPEMHLADSVRQRISLYYCVQTENLECVKEILEKLNKSGRSMYNYDFLMNQANILRITGHPKESAALLEESFSAHILNSHFDIRHYVYYILIEDYMELREYDKAEKLAEELPLGYRAYLLMKIMDSAGKKDSALRFAGEVLKDFPEADSDFYILTEAREYAEQGNRRQNP
ncbi:MAG: tetratricopeptide repeat protein [Holophagae bacterium]|nr:tetratricopeptide repeat protein [Holophagae bacterium]